MTAPYYFLPGLSVHHLADADRKLNRTLLAERGLDGILGDVESTDEAPIWAIDVGPGEKPGVMLYAIPTHGTVPEQYGFDPSRQKWTAADEDTLWIGIDRESPPTPEDLERKVVRGGYFVTLADGNQWSIPIVRSEQRQFTSLPTRLIWDRDGAHTGAVAEPYAALWEEAGAIRDSLYGPQDDQQEIDEPRAFLFALNVLCVNYRFGAIVQQALEPVRVEHCFSLIQAALDVPCAQSMAKAGPDDQPPAEPSAATTTAG